MKKTPPPVLSGPAPGFSLPDSRGRAQSLDDLQGKFVILTFLQDPEAMGAVKHLHAFKILHGAFQKVNAVIVAISDRPPEVNAELERRIDIPFALLGDESRETIRAYRAWGGKSGKQGRWNGVVPSTVIVDPAGEIRKNWTRVRQFDKHPPQVLEALRELTS